MKQKAKYIITVAVLIIGFFTAKKLRKLLQLKKFKLSVDNFELVNKLDPSALQQGVDTDLSINLQNYSNHDFQLDQLSIDLYTPSGQLLAQQINPLSESVQLISNKVSKLKSLK